MKFDDLLRDVGEFGSFQKRVYAFMCVPAVTIGSFMILNVVILGVPEHRYVCSSICVRNIKGMEFLRNISTSFLASKKNSLIRNQTLSTTHIYIEWPSCVPRLH